MRSPARVLVALAVVLVTALAGLAAPAQATDTRQLVYGAIKCPKLSKCPGMKVLWFDKNWNYLGTARANGGGYSLRLAPGGYHLQFVDQRPAYDTSKYAPTDIAVTVGRHTVSKSVTMKPGAAITGLAQAGGKPLRNARIVAANKSEQSFATTANKKGQFAVGGLPAGQYCLFTYDKAKKHVGKCTWVGGVNFGQVKDSRVTLTKTAGNLTVFLKTRDGGRAPASTVTVTSRTTGQWWSTKARDGKAVLRGLYPGRYNLKYDGGGIWLGATGVVHGGSVRPQRMAFGDFTVPKRGAWVTGAVVDGGAPSYPMADAQLRLFDAAGRLVASATSDSDGNFRLQGQLTTQDGMTILVDPKANSGGWMQGAMWCKFDEGTFEPVSVTTGVETYVGDIQLPRSTGSDQTAECRP
ncbi:hypothetical protein [Nocardioides aquiterrae]|uniref:Carboxypeptidase regulatory-like domain-containing protein n=1 Tax=Nocardioides aquiterrae TaxID=203799 RepID=A0ABN1UTH2_9ACTN